MSQDNKKVLDEIAKKFVSKYLHNYEWLFDLSEKYSLNLEVLQELMLLFDRVPQLKKEGELLNVGLVVQNEQVELEEPIIKRKTFPISEYDKISGLKNSISGAMLCYLIDKKGFATIKQIPTKIIGHTARLTMQNVSKTFSTMTICFEGLTIFVFDSGEITQIYRESCWIKPCSIKLDDLAKQGFPIELLQRALDISYQLSERNIGGTIIITKDENPRYCSSMNNDCIFEKQPLNRISDTQLRSFANLDGAIIFNLKQELAQIGQRLESLEIKEDFEESGRGTRHCSARKYTKVTDSTAFVISEDGPISVYYNGDLIGRCFGELFGKK